MRIGWLIRNVTLFDVIVELIVVQTTGCTKQLVIQNVILE